jgi:tetratricopeptide (TPR) repeat protein
MKPDAPYTVRSIERMTGLPRPTISALVAAGFVFPSRGSRNELRFTFQDLLLLRTAQSLRLARLPTRKILRALKALRASLPETMPLTGLRVLAIGDSVAVRDGTDRWEAESGQLLLTFDVEPDSGDLIVAPIGLSFEAKSEPESQHAQALTSFDRAVALEAVNESAAETAYRQAIALHPCFEDAYLNLGALLCEAQRCGDAVELFDEALRHCGDAPLLQFNRGIALEDQGNVAEAVAAYAAALSVDPELADAHYNLAVLLERNNDFHGALRHFNAYRRLMKAAGVAVPLVTT